MASWFIPNKHGNGVCRVWKGEECGGGGDRQARARKTEVLGWAVEGRGLVHTPSPLRVYT